MDLDEGARERQLGGFANVDASGADHFVARLDAMHAMASFQAYKGETFGLLGLTAGASVADVGCGTGEGARKLAALVAPGGRVVGYDASETMLEQARARHGDVDGLSFERADIEALAAENGAFDAARADRVLIHVPDPARALGEMLRVVRHGGRVMACEPDMPGCWIAAENTELSELVMRHIARSCAHPYVARNLFALFRGLGVKDVDVTIKSVTGFSPDVIERTLHVRQVLEQLVQKGLVAAQDAGDWAADLQERGRTGRFLAGVSIMVVSGTKA